MCCLIGSLLSKSHLLCTDSAVKLASSSTAAFRRGLLKERGKFFNRGPKGSLEAEAEAIVRRGGGGCSQFV